ncbi:MAG: threonine aldolase family protein [Acidimicrobiales bacterium]
MTEGALVDLRSDTVTRPTPAMRRAMAEAEVGDDGYGEDPTVNRLEATYAGLVGKEASVFVPSGVMANQIALRLLAEPGSLVVAGRRSHLVAYELGAAARNAAVQLHPVDDASGALSPADVVLARQGAAHHLPPVSLVCVENTHMAASGAPWSLDELDALAEAAAGLPVHMDGARLFNAVVATGVAAARLAAAATTVMSCLSKGLGAPVGSLLAGPAPLIDAARRERKRLGGGMRQAGVLAAAGLVALEPSSVDRLADDHRRARRLAEVVADRWPGGGTDPSLVRTNIVVFGHPATDKLLEHLRGEGVAAGTVAPGQVRLVTHRDVDDAGLERAVAALRTAP